MSIFKIIFSYNSIAWYRNFLIILTSGYWLYCFQSSALLLDAAIILVLASRIMLVTDRSFIPETNFIRTDASILTLKIAFAPGAVRLSIDTARLKLSNLLHVSSDHRIITWLAVNDEWFYLKIVFTSQASKCRLVSFFFLF